MSTPVSRDVLRLTTHEAFRFDRNQADRMEDGETRNVDFMRASEAQLMDLHDAATKAGEAKLARAVIATRDALYGTSDYKVPNFQAFVAIATRWIRDNEIKGWVFQRGDDGLLRPWAVTMITQEKTDRHSREKREWATISLAAWGQNNGNHGKPVDTIIEVITFLPAETSRRSVAAILEKRGLFTETADLHAEYEAQLERGEKVLLEGFARQMRVTGAVEDFTDRGFRERDHAEPIGRKVIVDIDRDQMSSPPLDVDSLVLGSPTDPKAIPLPRHAVIKVFDLTTHENYWVDHRHLEMHVYDKSMGEKLILPDMHRELLDILTTDISVFTGDIVEGKSAGNIILCKGLPGVGKTLTAEVYAELTDKPLYSIHAGVLGTTAETIANRLREVFQRAKRWNCVLLLDEADVFVMARGDDVGRNAIVAEFLRTMEYFDGLMFMTTNRPDDIDDAVVSRCAAIIGYSVPETDHARRIWGVMAKTFGVELPDTLVAGLLHAFPTISSRDIKMLLRMGLRVAKSRGVEIDIDIMRQCAMFRAIDINSKGAAA